MRITTAWRGLAAGCFGALLAAGFFSLAAPYDLLSPAALFATGSIIAILVAASLCLRHERGGATIMVTLCAMVVHLTVTRNIAFIESAQAWTIFDAWPPAVAVIVSAWLLGGALALRTRSGAVR
jgi:hypothetical protein